MSKTWKAIIGVILIYIFGCVSGAVCTSIFAHRALIAFLQHPAVAASKALENRLTGNLHLDPNQRLQVDGFFLDNLQQRRELQKQIHPQIQALNTQTVQQILTILRPDQKDLFHHNIDTFRQNLGATAFDSNVENLFSAQAQPTWPATNSGASQPPGQ